MNKNKDDTRFGSQGWARATRICVHRSAAGVWLALLYSVLAAITAFLLAVYWLGRSLSTGQLSLVLAAVAGVVLGLFLLQQLSGRWIFNGGYLYFSSFFVSGEYKLSEFSSLSASRRKGGRVLALSLSSELQYGESLEFWFRDWRRRSLCELMSAILESNRAIQVTPTLAQIIYLWAKQPGAGAALLPEVDLLEDESLPVIETSSAA